MRPAVLPDIHSNGQALHAVLADLDRLGGADHVWVLGDIALLGPHPAEAVKPLREREAKHVSIGRVLKNPGCGV